MKFKTLLGAIVGLTFVAVQSVHASPITLDLTYTGSGSVSGTGSATFDNSLFAPGTVIIDFSLPLAQLAAFSLNLTGLPGATTIGLSDLTGWFLAVGPAGGVGGINDLNFYMRNGSANAGGFSIEGGNPFKMLVCNGAAVSNNCTNPPPIDTLTLTGIRQVPEPATLAIFGLGLAGLGLMRRRRRSA